MRPGVSIATRSELGRQLGGRFPFCNLFARGGALLFLFAGGHLLFVGAKPGALGDLFVQFLDQIAQIRHAFGDVGGGLAHLRQFRLALGEGLAFGFLQAGQAARGHR